MRIALIVVFGLSLNIGSFAQGITGALLYQTARFGGKAVPIYNYDPSDPTYEVHGENRALYARRDPVLGTGFWAQLWTGPSRATEAGLSAVPLSLVHFRENLSAIQGDNAFKIPGTLGGDEITIQLRVWAAVSLSGKPASSWQDVIDMPDVPRGKSRLATIVLGNISADNKPYIPPNMAFALEGFGLYIVPEPSVLPLAGLGALGLLGMMVGRPGSLRKKQIAVDVRSAELSNPSTYL
ncbi:MAG: hypothetical protein HYR88_01815 [Verrucomicrobia bacterium]|nr:hypothetical protein [Verrucomicrobiota bacterium]